MKFFAAALFLGAAIAAPATLPVKLATRAGVCGHLLYSNPSCCSTDVLGIVDLNCSTPSSAKDLDDFKKACASLGAAPHCCTTNIARIGVLCQEAS